MKQFLLIVFFLMNISCDTNLSAQAIEGTDICPVEMNLEGADISGVFQYGVYIRTESKYKYIEDKSRQYTDVEFIPMLLTYFNGERKRRLEYVDAKDNTIILPPKKNTRENYEVTIKFGTYGLSHSGLLPNSVHFLVNPKKKDINQPLTNIFKDLVYSHEYFHTKMGFNDPHLLILKERKDKNEVWTGSKSGGAYGYYFILWDKSGKPNLPDIAKHPAIESYEVIRLEKPVIQEITQELIYVDISQVKDRKGLYKELKSKFKGLSKSGIDFQLLISNGGEPYEGDKNNYKKTIKYIRTTETESPIANQDVEHLDDLIERKGVFNTAGMVGIHMYMSDLFYNTSTLETGEPCKVPLHFVKKLMSGRDCSKVQIFIHKENDSGKFEVCEYDCSLMAKKS